LARVWSRRSACLWCGSGSGVVVGEWPYSWVMMFRTVVQDGLIVVNTHGALPDGTAVKIVVPKAPRARGAAKEPTRSKKKGARKSGAGRAGTGHTPGYGMWADRKELGAPETAVDRLRDLTRRKRFA
jgi:hypothetical protein